MKSVSKKKVIKNRGSKGKVTKIVHTLPNEIRVEKALMDNFIALQRVMLNFSAKFDNLSGQIGKLLEIFEISAKSLAKRDIEPGGDNEDVRKVLEKLDNLSQQAGLIGKGLVLIHEANTRTYEREPAEMRPGLSSINEPIRMPKMMPKKSALEMKGYSKSIASQPPQPPQFPRPVNQETQENP